MLKGKAKTDYQREYMRKRRSNTQPVRPLVRPKQETLKALRELVKPKSSPVQPESSPKIPKYNPQIHKPGDVVLVQRGKKWIETVIPDIDGGGQPIPDYY